MRGKLTRARGDQKKGDETLNALEAIKQHRERSAQQKVAEVPPSRAASPPPSPAKPSAKRTTRRNPVAKRRSRQLRRGTTVCGVELLTPNVADKKQVS